jgi:hypothetical protein
MIVLHQFLYVLFTVRCTFIHFSELTYWQDATRSVPCFLLFFISEKLYSKYSQNWTKQKPKFLFYCNEEGVQRRDEEAPQGGHTRPWCDLGPSRTMGWCVPPRRPPTSPLRLFIHDIGKNLNTRASIHEKFRRGRHRRTPEPIPGNHRRRHLHGHARLRSGVWVVHSWTMGP